MSLTRRIRSLHERDGVILGVLNYASRFRNRVRSRIMAAALGAPGIYVGEHCKFLGVRNIKFGRRVAIFRGMWLEAFTGYGEQTFSPSIVIGDDCSFSDAVHITAINRIEIGNGVLFGSKVFVSDHNHGSYGSDPSSDPSVPPKVRELHSDGPVIIEENVWIGDNVAVLGPVRIGRGAVVGANSVVRQDVPPLTVVAGVPARPLRRYNPATRSWDRVTQTRAAVGT